MSMLATHLLTYGGILGATLYQSFYSGIVAYKALPLEMFSRLQHRIFPGYFLIQSVLSIALFATTPFRIKGTVLNLLLGSFLTATVNRFVVTPIADSIGTKRAARVELEGKSYRDPNVSDEMKALNKKFKRVHSLSMVFALGTIVSLVWYGIYFANHLQVISY